MSSLRDGVRRSVKVCAGLVHEAAAGVLDAVGELSGRRASDHQMLEAELEQARRQGRWLSDEERAHRLEQEQRGAKRQRLLWVLLVISVLLPPLWLSVPIWCGLIWWPRTTRKLLLFGGALAAAAVVLVVVLVVWLLLR